MFRAVVVGFTCLLVATTARADELGPGEKGVRLLLRVEAEVPADRALILNNTFQGADEVTPGQEMPISWSPARGDLQLATIDTSEAAKLPALRAAFDFDAIDVIRGRAVGCGGAFAGVRTLPETSPAATIRWTFRVGFNGAACKAEKIGVEYLDGSGKVVDPGKVEREPPITPPELQAASAKEPVKAETKADAAANPPATGGGCNVAGSGAGLAGLVLLGWRRRRS